jgi:nucleoside-diphosphate-sugar epimerase
MSNSKTTNDLADDLNRVLARTEPLWQELRGKRILITGATGFFGCWLLESFAWANRRLNLNARAVALSRHPQTLAQKAPHLAGDPAIALHAADVRCDDFPHNDKEIAQNTFSHIIHAATEASAAVNQQKPQVMFDTIVNGTRRTLDFAAANSVRKFLFVSSGAVYGTQPPQLAHISETFTGGPDPLDTANAYAEGKRSAELLCRLAASSELEIKIARCFAFVGPYMQLDAHFAIGNFIADRLRQRPVLVQGDGSAVRSYLYAADLMVWLWTILFKGQSGRAYNVGSEDALNIATLARAVVDALPSAVDVNIASMAVPGVPAPRYVPCTARAREELGLRVEVPLREAICRTHAWFSRNTFSADETSRPGTRARGTHA